MHGKYTGLLQDHAYIDFDQKFIHIYIYAYKRSPLTQKMTSKNIRWIIFLSIVDVYTTTV